MNNLETLQLCIRRNDKFNKLFLNENNEGKLEKNKVVAWLNKDLFDSENLSQLEEDCINVLFSFCYWFISQNYASNVSAT